MTCSAMLQQACSRQSAPAGAAAIARSFSQRAFQKPAHTTRSSRSVHAQPPRAFLQNLFRSLGGKQQQQQQQQPLQRRMSREEAAVSRLLIAVEGSERGLSGDEQQRAEIMAAIEELKELGSGSTTTGAAELSATWRLLWTTEKETLFILQRAGLFGTQAGDVYQVIDVDGGTLQNVITFPPEGAFIVDSGISISGEQRTDFKFRSATLKLPKGRRLRLPPFGQGWFDTVYVDDSIRVAQDVRGDTLVVVRDGPPRRFE